MRATWNPEAQRIEDCRAFGRNIIAQCT